MGRGMREIEPSEQGMPLGVRGFQYGDGSILGMRDRKTDYGATSTEDRDVVSVAMGVLQRDGPVQVTPFGTEIKASPREIVMIADGLKKMGYVSEGTYEQMAREIGVSGQNIPVAPLAEVYGEAKRRTKEWAQKKLDNRRKQSLGWRERLKEIFG